MPSTIPSSRVPLTDTNTNLITTEWFRFFQSLFILTGGGQTTVPLIVGKATATLDFPNTAAQHSSDLTVAIAGAVAGQTVSVGVPNACALANSCYTGWVSAPGVVTVRFNNYSAAAQNPPSGSFGVAVTQF